MIPTNNSPNITFSITIEEANKLFKALGNMPFAEVYELIGKLNEQVNRQLSDETEQNTHSLSDRSFNIHS